MQLARLSLLLVALLVLSTAAYSADRAALGRTEKLRILVDKVLMASNKWVMTEDHVKEIADAGFNSCPRGWAMRTWPRCGALLSWPASMASST